ncbi:DUF2236 domain-containing protein [Nocardia sp. NBC_01377]|uniref:oxygenase MpaB family protein n=1 Tax=Nocardia sp. NBC_01377 TaxID=2903595 RepID=UPI00324C3D89
MRIHAPMTGIEPISGKRYSANSPETQLWIHITGWHSVLKAYEVFGPGPLTPEEETRYWAERAEEGIHHLLWTPRSNGAGMSYYVGSRLLSLASIALLPKWMRTLGHFDRPGIVDIAVAPPAKSLVWAFTRFDKAGLLRAAPFIAPMAGRILAQHIEGAPPARLETTTPTAARERYGMHGVSKAV